MRNKSIGHQWQQELTGDDGVNHYLSQINSNTNYQPDPENFDLAQEESIMVDW